MTLAKTVRYRSLDAHPNEGALHFERLIDLFDVGGEIVESPFWDSGELLEIYTLLVATTL